MWGNIRAISFQRNLNCSLLILCLSLKHNKMGGKKYNRHGTVTMTQTCSEGDFYNVGVISEQPGWIKAEQITNFSNLNQN